MMKEKRLPKEKRLLQDVAQNGNGHKIEDKGQKRGPKTRTLSLYPLKPEDVVRAALRMPPEPKIKHHSKNKQVGKHA